MDNKVKVTKEKLLKDYLSSQLMYVEFTNYVENRVKNILIENGIKFQSISSRVKSYESLEKKLSENMINGINKNIKNLSDLSGIRVIFYDEEELNKFNRAIYEEFNVQSYKPSKDIMEYDGVNITVSLKKEINKFKDLLCEIQLTTLLSHAMNEFGHNIIYKDVDELQSKDAQEYEKIKSTFEDVRKDILKVMASLEFINKRVISIKSGAKNIELILGTNFKETVESVQSLHEMEEIINKMIEVIPILNEYEDKYKKIYDSGIIKSIVNKFSELPIETAKWLNYDTYEYKYSKLLEFLKSYKYLWIDDFKSIIQTLYLTARNCNIINKFDEFIEKLVVSDKVDSNKGLANFNVHEIIYSTINDESVDDYVRIKLAEYFCDLNYNYCEEVEMNKVSFISKKLNPNENYKNKIYNVITILFDILLNKNSKEALHSLININAEFEKNREIFDVNPIYDLFYDKYNELDIYSKNELYKSVSAWKNTILRKSKFYKKLKNDKIQYLYAMLFNHFIDEIPGSKHSEREEYRTNYLNNYIENFSDDNIDEIITILNSMDIKEINESYIYNAGKFLVEIGSLEKYGKKIFEMKWNEYILLGLLKNNNKCKFEILDKTKADKIITAIFKTGYINFNIIDDLILFIDKSEDEKIRINIIKLLVNNVDLVNHKKYKRYILKNIKDYNQIKYGIMGDILYNPNTEKIIIRDYSYEEICIMVENFKYSEFNRLDEFFLNDLFEKYPNDLRDLIKFKINENPNSNLYNSYNYINLTECSNFEIERYNNLLLCIDILKNNDYYKVSNYIHYLIGEFNEKLCDEILKYLRENDNYETYEIIIDLCRLFDVSLACWNIYEHIIKKVDSNDKLINEIDCLLFNTGVVSGDYGLSESFYNKYLYFKELKPKNEKLKSFVKMEENRFKVLYQDEKNRRDKDKIMNDTKYYLENKRADD